MSTTTTIKAGESGKTITLPEGKALTIMPTPGINGTVGMAYLLDVALGGTNSKQSWVIGSSALSPIGAYAGTQKVLITCTAGSIDAVVQDAVLTQSGAVAASITGTFAIGKTITAALPAGFVGTIQFTRTLTAAPYTKSNIAEAVATAVNSLSYTLQLTDGGYNVDVDTSAVVATSKGGPVPASARLRAVTVNNRMPSGRVSSAGNDSYLLVLDYFCGSGDNDGIVFSFNGWDMAGGTYTAAANSYTVQQISLKNTTRTTVAPVKFGGAATKTINPGDKDVQSDVLLPSQLGYTRFTRGQRLLLTIEFRLPAAGASICGQSGRMIAGQPQNVVGWFNSANTSIGNVYGTGDYTATGAALVGASASWVPAPIGLGYFSATNPDPDPKTIYGFGDSIWFGYTDNIAFSPKGYGIGQRAMIGDGSDAQLLAGLSFATTGITIAGLVSDPIILEYAKYCKDAVDESGTNTFGTGGGVTSAAVIAALRTVWATMRAKGIRYIHRTKLGLRLPPPSAWTLVNQSDQTTYATNWGPGGEVDKFNNTDLLAELAAGRIDALVSMSSWRGPEPTKWIANGTAGWNTDDGLHPKEALNALLAAEVRASIDSKP